MYKHTDECFHWKPMERDVMFGLGKATAIDIVTLNAEYPTSYQ